MAFYFANTPVQKADFVILGIPFDRTSSFIPGARFGPEKIRLACENIESYSPYQKKDVADLLIHDAGDLVLSFKKTEETLSQIEKKIRTYLRAKKRLLSFGGEHTITMPIVKAYKARFPSLRVIQFDAHLDLRNIYLAENFCHATTMRRVSEIVGKENLFQVGIRSGTKEEFIFKDNIYPFETLNPIKEIRRRLSAFPIYLTIDIDVLDSGIMPAVSTPEPGGITFQELLKSLLELRGCRIIGADIVEYNPLAQEGLAYASLLAKLAREVLLIMAEKSR